MERLASIEAGSFCWLAAEPPGRKCKPNQRPTGAELLKPAQHNRHVITQITLAWKPYHCKQTTENDNFHDGSKRCMNRTSQENECCISSPCRRSQYRKCDDNNYSKAVAEVCHVND
ncbi:hypothetical protein T08_8042 [Trichinella sp. T8]|nr:hypothetical protein T08_8042 [Trichinella sp. T8]